MPSRSRGINPFKSTGGKGPHRIPAAVAEARLRANQTANNTVAFTSGRALDQHAAVADISVDLNLSVQHKIAPS